jgi:hypothetical protein
MGQLLSAEEVMALLQGLKEENALLRPGPYLPAPVSPLRMAESLSLRRPVFNLKWISQWLTGLTTIRWPQL